MPSRDFCYLSSPSWPVCIKFQAIALDCRCSGRHSDLDGENFLVSKSRVKDLSQATCFPTGYFFEDFGAFSVVKQFPLSTALFRSILLVFVSFLGLATSIVYTSGTFEYRSSFSAINM